MAGKDEQRFEERFEQALELLPVEENQGQQGRRTRAVGITADVVNGNNRRYPRAVLAAALVDLHKHLHESAGQGRLVATGQAEHPSSHVSGRANILETVVKWEEAALADDGRVLL